jgi:hypothetical protein
MTVLFWKKVELKISLVRFLVRLVGFGSSAFVLRSLLYHAYGINVSYIDIRNGIYLGI